MTVNRTIRVACMQMSSTSNVEQNLAFITANLESSVPIDLLVLPENFSQMPEHQRSLRAEDDGVGKVQQYLVALAKRLNIVIVAGSLPIVAGKNSRPFARCLIVTPEGVRFEYDKLHLFDVDVVDKEDESSTQTYRESDSYCAGALSESQVSPRNLKIGSNTVRLGPSICYDLRFPELYRHFSNSGVDIITVPAAFTYQTGSAHWECLLRARAIENQAYVIAAAQVGVHENGRQTWGHSMVIDPWGSVLAKEPSATGLLYADLDLNHAERLRKTFPVMTHKRLV